MANTPILLLLDEVGIGAVLLVIEILFNIVIVDVVEEVEVELLHPHLFQLLFENFLYLAKIIDVVTGEFVGYVVAFTRVFFQQLSNDELRLSAVIPPRRIKIVDAVFDCVVEHLRGFCLVDLAASLYRRKAHTPHAKRRKLFILKRII